MTLRLRSCSVRSHDRYCFAAGSVIYLQGDNADKLCITLRGRVALHLLRSTLLVETSTATPGDDRMDTTEMARQWAADSVATPGEAALRVRRMKNRRGGVQSGIPGVAAGESAGELYGHRAGVVEEGDAFGHWELLQVCGGGGVSGFWSAGLDACLGSAGESTEATGAQSERS